MRGKSSQVSSSCLITFLKPLLNDGDDSFMGYLVSEVKIMDCSPNRCIFIETYWERMQKHFLFTLSSEFFEQLTDINTT